MKLRTNNRQPLEQRPAWKDLAKQYEDVRGRHLRELFAGDPERGERLTATAVGLYLDYSKNLITGEIRDLLVQLANQSGLRERI
ncbi:MAG TPA: glucose-6-phosphate isomerase, partial [Myxococcota bacterium]|nr:glucose-6-phosphate isomerase [Myxococcota bacterium]